MALDANGVWIYTEADSALTMSALLNKLGQSVSDQLGGGWPTYTPVLTASTTNPTNYTATGKYKKVGRILVVKWNIVCGASFTPGVGAYSISLPVATVVSGLTEGSGRLYDSSTGNAAIDVRVSSSTSTTLQMQTCTSYHGPLGSVTNAMPWVFAASDIMDGFAILESVS